MFQRIMGPSSILFHNRCLSGCYNYLLWPLLRVHLASHLLHPQQQIAHHVHELEQVARVAQAHATRVAQGAQLAPRVDHLRLACLDLERLVAGVGRLQSVE